MQTRDGQCAVLGLLFSALFVLPASLTSVSVDPLFYPSNPIAIFNAGQQTPGRGGVLFVSLSTLFSVLLSLSIY